jgi:putative membrane protein
MIGMLGSAYPWVKAAHIIFVIFWVAGMFMLPRYLVYHQEALEKTGPGSVEAQSWVERENKLRKMILSPSMILVWLLGLTLAVNLGLFSGTPSCFWWSCSAAIMAGRWAMRRSSLPESRPSPAGNCA